MQIFLETVKTALRTVAGFIIGLILLALVGLFFYSILLQRNQEMKFMGKIWDRLTHKNHKASIVSKQLTVAQRDNLNQSRDNYKQFWNEQSGDGIFNLMPPFRINYLIKTDEDAETLTMPDVKKAMTDSMFAENPFSITSYKIKHIDKPYFMKDTVFVLSVDELGINQSGETNTLQDFSLNISYDLGKTWFFCAAGFTNEDREESMQSLKHEFKKGIADSLYKNTKIFAVAK